MTLELFRSADDPETRVMFWQTDETAVMRRDVGEETRVMRPFLAEAPVSPIPRYVTDQHAALEVPATIADVTPRSFGPQAPPPPSPRPPLPPPPDDTYPPIGPAPQPPPTPTPTPVPPPAWMGEVAEFKPVRTRPEGRYVGRRRAPVPVWALLLAGLGSGVVGGALSTWAVLALAVLGVTR